MRLVTSLASAAASVVFISASAFAQEYVTIDMEIDIDKPAAEVWGKVGEYCGISEWLGLDCKITSGDGGMGSVRSLLGGRILEIMVAQTELSYGYAQPALEGEFYNLYHGFMEARPLTDSTTKKDPSEEVYIELKSQIETAINMGLNPSHLDSHMYTHLALKLFEEHSPKHHYIFVFCKASLFLEVQVVQKKLMVC